MPIILVRPLKRDLESHQVHFLSQTIKKLISPSKSHTSFDVLLVSHSTYTDWYLV